MKSILSSCLLLALSSPALAAECRSTEGQILSEPISVERKFEWNGLKETLELKGSKVSGGKLDGQPMKTLSLPCKAGAPQTVCEKVISGSTYRATVEGAAVIQTILLKNGNEGMRVVYACDKPPIPGK
jgi:N-dimethylarginine dimethylaminohydrolase